MAIYRTRAVVLKSADLGEADKIITMLTKDRGKVRAVARGVRRFRSRLVGGTLPFCFSDFLVYEGKSLDSISQCEIIESFMSLRDDLVKMAYASYIAELTSEFLPEGDVNEKVFLLILKTFRLMARGIDPETLTRMYELRLLSFLGYNPEIDKCTCCGGEVLDDVIRISPSYGGLVCSKCNSADSDYINIKSSTLNYLKSLAFISTDELKQLKLQLQDRVELTKVLRRFIAYHLEKNLKSLKFLDSVTK
jgi:DNA repair protein RecO (recombination protein O)